MIGDKFFAARDDDKFVVARSGRTEQLIATCVSEEWSYQLAEVLNRVDKLGTWVSGVEVPWPAGEEIG